MKVLVAEDDSVTRLAMAGVLRDAGYEVVEAHDGLQAISVAREEEPDALVIDERMPGCGGLEAVREICRERRLPVLLVTAYTDKATRRSAVEVGVHGFLVKPVSGQELLPALETACAAARREMDLTEEAQRAGRALRERRIIDRAKGIMMRRDGISEEEAYLAIQRRARGENRRMVDVAREILREAGVTIPGETHGEA